MEVFHDILKEDFVYAYSTKQGAMPGAFSMHTHNLYEILYFIKGSATHIIEDRKYKLKKGDLVFIRPQNYHYISIDEPCDYERFDILFNPTALGIENIDKIPQKLEVINCLHSSILQDIFKRFDYYNKNLNKNEFKKVATLLINEILLNLKLLENTLNYTAYTGLNPMLSDILKYVNENLFSIKGVDEIANKFFVTESYVFKLFKGEIGTTPKKYINTKRLLVAQRELMLGNSPTKIYLEVGFNDYTSFYRAYKKYFGYPPNSAQK